MIGNGLCLGNGGGGGGFHVSGLRIGVQDVPVLGVDDI